MKKTIIAGTIATTLLFSSFSGFAADTVQTTQANPYLTLLESTQNAFKDYVVKQFSQYVNISAAMLSKADVFVSIENPIILSDGSVSFSLIYTIEDTQIISSYLVKPAHEKIQGIDAIATFTGEITNLVGFDDNEDDEMFVDFIQTLQLKSEGFLTADGNLYDKTQNSAPYKKNGFDLPTVTLTSNTSSEMSLITANYAVPSFTYKDQKSDQVVDFKKLILDYQNKPIDNIYFSLIGNSKITLDSATFNDGNEQSTVTDFYYQSSGVTNVKGLVDNSGEIRFKANVKPKEMAYKIDFSSNFALENIDNNAFNGYVEAQLSNDFDSLFEKVQNGLKLLENGGGFSITNFKLLVNDAKATADIKFDMKPTKSSSLTNPANLLKALNNLTLEVNASIDYDVILIPMQLTKEDLEYFITQLKAQLDKMGLGDALTDNGKALTINFTIKQGNIYINNELKMPLVNLFMNFY